MSAKIVSCAMRQGIGAWQEHEAKKCRAWQEHKSIYHHADPADSSLAFLIWRKAAIDYLIYVLAIIV
ncbi:MAG: hypothetical protein EOM87_09135 [Clostridia bacterium]|nr:hypothetical protein [Clostridia bacterium]